MKSFIFLSGAMFVCTLLALSSCSTQDDKAMTPAAPAPAAKAEAKAPPAEAKAEKAGEAKAKATKVVGDVGLLDMEKNYMIIVTKEGKLIIFLDKWFPSLMDRLVYNHMAKEADSPF